MNKNLPKCLCGAEHRWTEVKSEVRESSLTGVTYHQDSYACPICERPGLLVEYDMDHDGENVFLIPKREPDSGFEERSFLWLESDMLPRWIANQKCRDDGRAVITERWRTYACLEFGLPPGTQTDDVPDTKVQAWRDFMETREGYPLYQYPPGYERVLMPPSLPEGTAAYVRSNAHGAGFIWREVKCRNETRSREAA